MVCCSRPHITSPYRFDNYLPTVTNILSGQFMGKCKLNYFLPFSLFANFIENVYFQSGNSYKDVEEIEYKREQPLIWREDTINNGTNGERSDGCRNSVQGKTLLVDDEGYVCPRSNLLNNGCCDSNENIQYSCDTCNKQEGCCGVYERCVSCCLNPNKVGQFFGVSNVHYSN